MHENKEAGSLLLLDPSMVTEKDVELMTALDQYKPATNYRPGDLFTMVREQIPSWIVTKYGSPHEIPIVWKVRFVVSKWAWTLMSILQSNGTDWAMGPDHAAAQVERSKLPAHRYYDALIYAHAYPHGINPDSAVFLEEVDKKGRPNTRRIFFREENPEWPVILDEARAPFFGIPTSSSKAPFTWNLAPDLYQDGENIGKPFRHEDDTVDALCMSGLERLLFDKRIRKERVVIDPEHDVFKKAAGE